MAPVKTALPPEPEIVAPFSEIALLVVVTGFSVLAPTVYVQVR